MSAESLKLDNQLCFPLYAASRKVIREYKPFLDPLELTYTQYITMMVMWEYGTITARELSQKLCLDSGTLTPLLKKLEQKGLITRSRSAEDERVMDVAVTERGRALEKQAETVPERIAGCFRLEPEEAAQLYGLLYKILAE